jgi:hypothetical protein
LVRFTADEGARHRAWPDQLFTEPEFLDHGNRRRIGPKEMVVELL